MDKLRLVLVGTEGAINLGMVARLSDNFEVDELYLVKPLASIEEAMEFAARSADRLKKAIIVESLESALEGVALSICTSSIASTEDVLRSPIEPRRAAEIAASLGGTVALVMGRESVGLTRSELRLCDLLSTIKASPSYPALNLANATAIMLYELFLSRGRGHYSEDQPSPETLRLIEKYVLAIAELTIADAARREEAGLSVRHILSKARPSRVEAENLLLLLSRAYRAVLRSRQGPREDI